jgi:hemolysin activation/secretion protein
MIKILTFYYYLIKPLLGIVFILSALPLPLAAQINPNLAQEQATRAQQNIQEQAKQIQPQTAASQGSNFERSRNIPTENEKPCFLINEIRLKSESAAHYQWILQGKDAFMGKCLGEKSLNTLLANVQNSLISKGLVTTRAVAGEQNLKSGTFEITLQEGRVGKIVAAKDTPARYPWWSGIGLRSGDLINQRDLEQAVENFKRLPTVEANFQLAPGEKELTSDIVIDWKQSKFYRASAQIDDSGSKALGILQGTASVFGENLLNLNDLFSFSYTRNLEDIKTHGTRGMNAHFSLPFDRWTLAFDLGGNKYHQTVVGFAQDYIYSGNVMNASAKLSRVIYRDQKHKTTIAFGLWGRSSNNYIDDTELLVQRRKNAGYLFEIKHKLSHNNNQFEWLISTSQAQKWWGAIPAPEDAFNEGASLPRLLKTEFTAAIPFTLGSLKFTYENLTKGQWTNQALIMSDRFSIAGRSTIRGFDGEATLAGENGWLTRNTVLFDIDSLIPQAKEQKLYTGLDYGEVHGPSTRFLTKNALTGAVVGFRGKFKSFDYDFFAGTTLAKPAEMKTPHPTLGFLIRATY